MALHSPHERVYERLLCYGQEGAGKTRNWLDIAWWAQKTGSDAQFYALDTDNAVPMMLTSEKFAGLTNVHDVLVSDWDEFVAAKEEVTPKLRPHDWLVIDQVGWGWGWLQDKWTRMRYGATSAEHWASWAVKGAKGNALEGDTDWGQINRFWRDFSGPLMRLQANLFCTAAAKKVGERDSAQIRKDYGRLGFRPEGQKDIGHLFHGILYAQPVGSDEWVINTAKDRGDRKYLEGEVVKSFTRSYLMGVAGWKP